MRAVLYGTVGIGIYLVVVMAPLFVLLAGPAPPGRGFWREFSVGLGFAGLSMMGVQFFLTGRFRRIAFPYGIDIIYHFHRQISLVAFLVLSAHPVTLFASSSVMLAFLNPLDAPRHLQARGRRSARSPCSFLPPRTGRPFVSGTNRGGSSTAPWPWRRSPWPSGISRAWGTTFRPH